MILTGNRITTGVNSGEITIHPFYPENIEPNSYRVSLGQRILDCATDFLDAQSDPAMVSSLISDSGRILEPGHFYLGETSEVVGSNRFATTLYATRSLASMGMWVHFSAPLGHSGAIIRWTLEIQVAQKIIVYPGMPIGKIAFWFPLGATIPYRGRYLDSTTVRRSAMFCDQFSYERGQNDPDRSTDNLRSS